jgi:hypothetical protein
VTIKACRARVRIAAGLIAAGFASLSRAASAEPNRVVVLPTSVGEHLDCTIASPDAKAQDAGWVTLARRIDGLVADAVEDAGMETELRLNVSRSTPEKGGCVEDTELRALAQRTVVLSPRLVLRDGRMVLRIVALSPNSSVLRLVTQEISEKELDFRTVVMVSEVLSSESASSHKTTASQPLAGTPAAKTRSQGKGVLALTSAVLGGGIGYSLQRASGSNDARLTYPLIALGAGMGLGASLIASEEWDLSVGEAWYLNAGMIWPTTSGMLLAYSYDVTDHNPKDNDADTKRRYIYGLVGATAGMSLASLALNFREISEGGAVLTHSGGAMGLLLGGLVDMTYYGTSDKMPYRGMGYGAGVGVLLAGAAATQLRLSSSRVLFIDLSAGLGALTGAALGALTLVVDADSTMTTKQQRTWLGAVGVGAVVGAGVGWFLTRGWTVREHEGSGAQAKLWPYAAATPSPIEGAAVNISGMTAGVQGTF